MSAVFWHGMRYEFLPRVAQANPTKYIQQGRETTGYSRRSRSRPISAALFGTQTERGAMALLDCGTGLRRDELIGLKWGSGATSDFEKKQMNVVRSGSRRRLGDVKTEPRKKPCRLTNSRSRNGGILQDHAVPRARGVRVRQRLALRGCQARRTALLARNDHASFHSARLLRN